MKNTFIVFALIVLSFAFPANAAPQIGQPAPSFFATDSFGKNVSSADFKGKMVILEWTNHDCPFVRKHYNSGNMQALQKKYTGQGVVWLTVISSAPGKQGYVTGVEANEINAKRDAAPTAVLIDADGKIGKAYDAKTTPHMYIIEPNGNLAYMGAIDSINSADVEDIEKAKNYVDLAMADLAANRPVAEPFTKAYGCGVKY
ncbi:MAG: redoxin domain-containing protein [Dongiaceae bacterium]